MLTAYEVSRRQEAETIRPLLGYVEMLVSYHHQDGLLPDKHDIVQLARLCAEFRASSRMVDEIAKVTHPRSDCGGRVMADDDGADRRDWRTALNLATAHAEDWLPARNDIKAALAAVRTEAERERDEARAALSGALKALSVGVCTAHDVERWKAALAGKAGG